VTEQEWLACTDPREMLEALQAGGLLSERKVPVFAVACCRGAWPLMPDEGSRRAVEAAEKYADGVGRDRDLRAAVPAAWGALQQAPSRDRHHDPAWAAYALAFTTLTTGSIRELPVRRWGGGCWSNLSTPERAAHAHLLHCIWGNPFRPVSVSPAWQTGQVVALAQTVYDERELPAGTLDAARLAVLADALEEAGCDQADILNHCRQPGVHVRGCWVVDLLLGKV
jgi:hypothetical protein